MVLIEQDFYMVAGDDEYVNFHIDDEDGEDLDLTPATIIDWYMKESENSDAALVHKDSGTTGGITILAPATAGNIQVHIDSADTASLSPDKYFHGVVVTIGGDVHTVALGYVTLLHEVIGS